MKILRDPAIQNPDVIYPVKTRPQKFAAWAARRRTAAQRADNIASRVQRIMKGSDEDARYIRESLDRLFKK